MSKAEERAQAVYPAWRNGLDEEFNSSSAYCGFIEGYHQAEKDLALTWEDMRDIYNLAYNLRFPHKKQKEFFEEVLKRFKAKKR